VGRLQARELVDDFAVAEHLHERNAHDVIALREHRVLVDVDLREHDLVLVAAHGVREQRSELAARRAPRRPEVHEHGDLTGALDDVVFERRVRRVHPYPFQRCTWHSR